LASGHYKQTSFLLVGQHPM